MLLVQRREKTRRERKLFQKVLDRNRGVDVTSSLLPPSLTPSLPPSLSLSLPPPGPMESSSFMNALFNQAAKMKEKRVKKVVKSSVVRRERERKRGRGKEGVFFCVQVKSSPTQTKPPVEVPNNHPQPSPTSPSARGVSVEETAVQTQETTG